MHIARRFYAGYIGEFEESFRHHADAETPLFGLAGFEVGELLACHGIPEDVLGRGKQCRCAARTGEAVILDFLQGHAA